MNKTNKTIVVNKNAKRNFALEDNFKAGIVFEGWEVKSLRNGKVDVKDTYVILKKNEAWLIGLKIDPPASLKIEVDKTKSRKLLLHKREIFKISDAINKKGLTCVLTKIYWKNNKIKCDIDIGRGKKRFDQRQDIKKRDWERKRNRLIKNSKRR